MSKPNLFFPTPVWTFHLENYKILNEELYSFIKNIQMRDQKGIQKSNNKSWHSKDFDLQEAEPKKFINQISSYIEKIMIDMNWRMGNQNVKISNMWTIVNTGGSSNSKHQHGNSTISGAYYVRAPENCGDILFYDPRPAPVFYYPNANSFNMLNAQVHGITPKEGGLILFPSYVDHSVNENLSNEERIVISFNIKVNF